MLIRVGDERTDTLNIVLAGFLSSIAGGLNAVGFLILGTFTANMTGNVSMMADDLADGRVGVGLSLAGLVIAFIVGACAAAVMVNLGERRRMRMVYALAIGVEGFVVLVLGAGLLCGGAGSAAALVGLSVVMGGQNAVTTMISRSKVRTTHVSGMATDIGIELAALIGPKPLRGDALPKLRLHSVTLAAFASGGILGALLFDLCGAWLFVLAGVSLMGISLAEICWARRYVP
ncbi:YoaK family protein (plasmid) [Thioclava litoralis]|uniref:YoaK family protein n=1 Tax=Thioclava litoralis TaxID=3076557 RepID=A0ABZ1E3U8_9RHOB|nr:YoaK family protein [Thioclava sp. FTW29]